MPQVTTLPHTETSGTSGTRLGDDDNHVDYLRTEYEMSSGVKMTDDEWSAHLLKGKGKTELLGGSLKGKGTLLDGRGDGSDYGSLSGDVDMDGHLGLLEGETDIGGTWTRDKIEGKAGIKGGAYAAKGGASGGLGFRIPFTNIEIGASGSAQGSVGVGGEASAHGSLSWEDGLDIGGTLGGVLGIGGSLGAGLKIGKSDPESGWFG